MAKLNTNELFYKYAYKFLIDHTQGVIDEKSIRSYLTVSAPELSCKKMSDVFCRMLLSAQNRQMSRNVIGGSIGGVENLAKVLRNFDARYVSSVYLNKETELLKVIQREFSLGDKINIDEKSLWFQYCKTIVSVANFLSPFNNYKEFLQWIRVFYNDEKSAAALPLIISEEVFGFGFALACDFLKELGFENYGKPDVHVKEILSAYNFISETASDYSVLKTMIQMSKDAKVSCYELDKVLWLIGSGKFYNHPNLGKNGFVGKMKSEFIKQVPDFLFRKKINTPA